MSATSRRPEADPLYARPAPQRPHYATGILLDAGDFRDEQTYHRGRLASALAALTGGGTLAGLRVAHVPAEADVVEEIRVAAGLAADRLGRLVEVSRPACLRLERWWEATMADDEGDTLVRASYDNLERFVSARAAAEAGEEDRPPLPARAVVADVFLRFIACENGFTPSFASGPFDALDAVATSRLRDAYELLLIPRDGLDDDFDGLPPPGPDLAAIADPEERQAALHDAVLDSWPAAGTAGQAGTLAPLPEHPTGADPTAQFIARVLIPVTAGLPPERDGAGVVVDNWSRRFVPSIRLLQRLIGT
jgi:hypothetical protein